MLNQAQREYATLALLLLIFLTFLLPSLAQTRAQVRDDLRRQDITYLKRSLEQFYNQHEFYPGLTGTDCLTSVEPSSWNFIDVLPHDVREKRGHLYRYCVTSQDEKGAAGYFLEASLEAPHQLGLFFDEDEQRKFHYRILQQNNQILYRVCGGEEKQCQK